MAFDKCKNGAWQEPEELVKRYDNANGYWVDCEEARKHKDGAWTEVWANIKWLSLLSNTITTGDCYLDNNGLEIILYKIMGYFNGWYGTISGSGKMILYLDGEWTNPTISFDYYGGFVHKTSESTTIWQCVSAGKVSLYSRTTSGTVTTKDAVTRVGKTQQQEGYVESEEGSYEGTLTGTFNRLGIEIYLNGFGENYFNAILELRVSNLRINGKKIGFPESAEYSYQEWP